MICNADLVLQEWVLTADLYATLMLSFHGHVYAHACISWHTDFHVSAENACSLTQLCIITCTWLQAQNKFKERRKCHMFTSTHVTPAGKKHAKTSPFLTFTHARPCRPTSPNFHAHARGESTVAWKQIQRRIKSWN